eukprot:2583845-Amphidinium_carterae.2
MARPPTGSSRGTPSGNKGAEIAILTGHSSSSWYLRLQEKSFLQQYEVMPHREQALGLLQPPGLQVQTWGPGFLASPILHSFFHQGRLNRATGWLRPPK